MDIIHWPKQPNRSMVGEKGVWNYLPIVPKATIYVPKVMLKPVMGGNTHTSFSSEVGQVSKSGPDSQFGALWLSMGGKGALNYLPILCPKVIVRKEVIQGIYAS